MSHFTRCPTMEVTHYSVTVFRVEWASLSHCGNFGHPTLKIVIFGYRSECV